MPSMQLALCLGPLHNRLTPLHTPVNNNGKSCFGGLDLFFRKKTAAEIRFEMALQTFRYVTVCEEVRDCDGCTALREPWKEKERN